MKVSEWIQENIDSHGIYDTSVLDDLPEPVRYDSITDELIVDESTKVVTKLPLASVPAAQMRREQGALETGNPKGAFIDANVTASTRLVGGYQVSRTIDRLLTGEDGGVGYYGRGTAHRARIAHLANAGY